VLIGINLLREGLDIPEVSLVAILDADKEGFLRSTRSLIQTVGRAARNVAGRVIMYADRVTESMRAAIDETDRRRETQRTYNEEHGIVPKTTRRSFAALQNEKNQPDASSDMEGPATTKGKKGIAAHLPAGAVEIGDEDLLPMEIAGRLEALRGQMLSLAKQLRYEDAAQVRDRIRVLEARMLEYSTTT
jgi:excinuclease ABC subunit B